VNYFGHACINANETFTRTWLAELHFAAANLYIFLRNIADWVTKLQSANKSPCDREGDICMFMGEHLLRQSGMSGFLQLPRASPPVRFHSLPSVLSAHIRVSLAWSELWLISMRTIHSVLSLVFSLQPFNTSTTPAQCTPGSGNEKCCKIENKQ